MQNIQKLYQDLHEGKISKNQFLFQIRKDSRINSFFTSANSYDETVRILKNRGLLFEVKPQKLNENSENNLTINGKKVKNYSQEGDKSYTVDFEDGTTDNFKVSNDNWDIINADKKEGIDENQSQSLTMKDAIEAIGPKFNNYGNVEKIKAYLEANKDKMTVDLVSDIGGYYGLGEDELGDANSYLNKDIDEASEADKTDSMEALAISKMTNTRVEAVEKFINENNIDAKKLLRSITSGGMVERVRLIKALSGEPNNSTIKWYAKNYSKELPEAPSHEETDANQVYENDLNEGAKIVLVNPDTNKFIKTVEFSGPNKDSDKEVKRLNSKLTTAQKDKGLYWKVSTLNEAKEPIKGADQVNPYELEKGTYYELDCQKDGAKDTDKAKAKALKNLNKNPKYYSDLFSKDYNDKPNTSDQMQIVKESLRNLIDDILSEN